MCIPEALKYAFFACLEPKVFIVDTTEAPKYRYGLYAWSLRAILAVRAPGSQVPPQPKPGVSGCASYVETHIIQQLSLA